AAAAPIAAAAPTAAASAPTALPLDLGVSGAGEITAAQDADLSFLVQGTVDQVLVEEGALVRKGDLLAILDVRGFDQQVQQAEAALASAQAQQAALTEDPREADLAAARAGVRQAQEALKALQNGPKAQDIQAAEAAVALAESNLQSTRDRLSFAKTQAELSAEQAAFQLTQAQARYAQAKYNWTYAQETGNDPIVPEVTTAQGRRVENKLSDGQLENYYAQYVQAEAALKQAEKAVELAVKAAESARQAEVTGIQAAEAQLAQARLQLEKLRLPPDADRLAAAQAALANARAQEARVLPDPRASQMAAAAAGVAQAEAALTLARINRERAELRAPFDGVVSIVNIDPGDPGVLQGAPAIQVVDVSSLRVDVSISDVDIARVRVGQRASVRVDGIPEREYTGTVSFVSPTAVTRGTIRTFLVRVQLDDITGLRAGMSARVDILER
ncbi:MAG TPA: HlyD family efflux transporter periplasmic adaptor subunit, partial [Roseiflexaceae bacterium]|nr:HlyD family efflux transporter periplasmic adaptor subunit [Roseiflexaceae bacterium]